MGRYAIVNAGVVRNIVEARDAESAGPQAVAAGAAWQIGGTWDGATYSGPSDPPAPAASVPVPRSVTARQAKRALLAAGVTDADVEAVIGTLPEPLGSQARIDWRESTEFLRHNPTLVALAPLIGITAAEVDALFISASRY